MPQETSRYPPIHDQMDTPTDFSVAVWEKKGGQQRRDGGRSQREAEHGQDTQESKSSTCHSSDGGNGDIKTTKSGIV